MNRLIAATLAVLAIAGCASTPPTMVIDRTPAPRPLTRQEIRALRARADAMFGDMERALEKAQAAHADEPYREIESQMEQDQKAQKQPRSRAMKGLDELDAAEADARTRCKGNYYSRDEMVNGKLKHVEYCSDPVDRLVPSKQQAKK